MKVRVSLGKNSYTVFVGAGILRSVSDVLNLDRRVFIITDSGVPSDYSVQLARQCNHATILTIPAGEKSKSISVYSDIISAMTEAGMTRHDCVIALGGGVVGDITGFSASTYMRGVDFYNIPTTLLSQVDASIGGKTAIDFKGCKNLIGSFYQPKAVIVDTELTKTLPQRQLSNGMAEIIKIGAVCNRSLFEKIEKGNIENIFPELILEAIKTKKSIVEEDVNDTGIRQILNFGHTIGHGIESASRGNLLHGECVGLGMLCMSQGDAQRRIAACLDRYCLPRTLKLTLRKKAIIEFIKQDKKSVNGNEISVSLVDDIGSHRITKMTLDDLTARLGIVMD